MLGDEAEVAAAAAAAAPAADDTLGTSQPSLALVVIARAPNKLENSGGSRVAPPSSIAPRSALPLTPVSVQVPAPPAVVVPPSAPTTVLLLVPSALAAAFAAANRGYGGGQLHH